MQIRDGFNQDEKSGLKIMANFENQESWRIMRVNQNITFENKKWNEMREKSLGCLNRGKLWRSGRFGRWKKVNNKIMSQF